ncbi:SNF2-related protein [Apiospora rasikravindrae]|uniref:SNF2-related protein n=1 Tax=Apiospora rasikravindrae TaxID=990691 RepID=A0ABR1TGW4_9PEZI
MDFTPFATERSSQLQEHTMFLPSDPDYQQNGTATKQAQELVEISTPAPVAPVYGVSFPHKAVSELPGGELPDVVTLFRWTPKDAPSHTRQGSDKPGLPGWESLSVGVQEDCAYLSTESGQAVCVVNRRVSHAVVELQKLGGLQYKAFAQAAEWRARLKERRTARTGRKDTANIRLKVSVIVLGPGVAADEAARVLAQNQLFLQEPHEQLNVHPYINPQSLHIPELLPSAGYTEALSGKLQNGLSDCNAHVSDDLLGPGLVDLVLNIDEFYQHVPGHDYLQEAHIDGRIRTPLLGHQKIAVDFMLRRESGISQLCRSLWTARISDDGLKVFEHVITGAKCRTAQDCPGGLIADDAGLGKTLTTLAIIVNTLTNAEAFEKQDESHKKATLVVVPSELLLTTWRDEIRRHIYLGAINFEAYHGQGRQKLGSMGNATLPCINTTGIESSWTKAAHHIRNPASKQARAANGLRTRVRWCLTGTPIQNKLDDLGSIVKFLKVPYLENPTVFNKYITRVLRQGDIEHGYDNLKQLLGSICLRRNRSIMSGPGYCTETVRPEFDQAERENYRSLEFRVRHAVMTTERSTRSKQAHHMIMEALLRLRMFCNIGLAAVPSSAGSGESTFSLQPDEILAMLQQAGEAMCFYCSADIESLGNMNAYDSGILTQCSSLVCSDCVSQYHEEFKSLPTPRCPICNFEHEIAELTPKPNGVGTYTQLNFPSKVEALLEDVQNHYLSKKCLIFSFWKKTLDMIGHAFESRGLSYLRVDGSMSSKKRNNVLNRFQTDSSSRILMMTFSTGGVGLNGLTVANRIYIMEPQWNPAVEQQAIGRVLRIDQSQPVTVVSYVMQRSIEEASQSPT